MNRKNRDGRVGDGGYKYPDIVTYVDLRPRTDQLTVVAERDGAAARKESVDGVVTILWPAV